MQLGIKWTLVLYFSNFLTPAGRCGSPYLDGLAKPRFPISDTSAGLGEAATKAR